ncbi:DUF2931 family protein [Mucilaginibacter sp. L196]|uniref:DUF2931 family protein n=1 Tax=Mucilaginibacter sp. L196 TaxID=1641870 RepID=UPI0020B121A1|nr:DUF2931 family protein [Mucilaginibacter sp. L196]
MEETFEWSPGVGAAHLYPMELYRCTYIYPDGDGVSPASPNLEDGTWGQENGSSAVGEMMKPIPVALDITWLSYTENKFYKGHFQLPHDKILQLFKQGHKELVREDNGELAIQRMDYNNIIAGMAPGGVVVVWVNGGDVNVEVGRFQAVETKVNMEDFIGRTDIKVDQNSYVKQELSTQKDVLNNINKNGIPFGLWDKYRKRFNQQVIIKFDQNHHVGIDNTILNYYNGEKETLFAEKWIKNDSKQRAMVKDMRIGWTDSLGGKSQYYILEVKFDEAEMFKAYKEAYGDDPNQAGELITEINRGNDHYKIYLQVGDKKVELLKQKGEFSLYNAN